MDDVEECSQAIDLVQFARQSGGQIEAKAVHVHLENPVTQTIHDQLQNPRMLHVQRVSGARIVHVVARIVRHKAVVGAVVDALERERWAKMIAFRRVVVDNIQNHFESRRVQGLDHGLEFADGVGCQIARLKCKKSDGVVSPVVAQAAFHELAVVHEAVHRHELDRGHSRGA